MVSAAIASQEDEGVDMPHATTPLGRWALRNAALIDGTLAFLLFLYDAMYLASQFGGLGTLSLPLFVLSLVISAGICVLYVLRRRWPRVVPALILLAAWGYVLLGVGISPGPLVLIALVLYFLGARRTRRVVLLAALLAAVWLIVAAQPLLAKEYLRIGEVGVLVLAAFLAATLGMLAQARRHHVEQLEQSNARLARERDAQARIAAAEERARIAREIHGIVSHSLGTMVVMADGAARTSTADPERAGRAMSRVRDTGRDALAEMRAMVDVLRVDDVASRAPQPGLRRLEQLIDEARATGIRVDLERHGAPRVLPAGLDLAAYRIVQEALTNARNHGGPLLSVVTVSIVFGEDTLELQILDYGAEAGATSDVGSEDEASWSTGHGLVGMRERTAAYGGTLDVGPRPEGGFAVHAVFPIGGTR